MIDEKHRLRPERVHKYKANVFRDIKFLFVSVWDELFHRKSKETEDKNNDQLADECTPLIH
jgi:hypothetical protein